MTSALWELGFQNLGSTIRGGLEFLVYFYFHLSSHPVVEECDDMLGTLLAPEYAAMIPYIKLYFLSSFGSFIQMDYGTGHETPFALIPTLFEALLETSRRL